MRRKLVIVLFIALTVKFSFSQEQKNNVEFGMGSRVAFSVADIMINDIVNLSSAIGLVVKFPITNTFSFNQELNFVKREFSIASTSYSCEGTYALGGSTSYTLIDEFAISVPVLIQIMPINIWSFYLETGIQLDIPFASKIYETDYERPAIETYYYTRAKYDWGFVLGFGWHIGKSSVLGTRGVLGLTDIVNEEDVKYISLGLNLSYFF
jgi:hypothetical protein